MENWNHVPAYSTLITVKRVFVYTRKMFALKTEVLGQSGTTAATGLTSFIYLKYQNKKNIKFLSRPVLVMIQCIPFSRVKLTNIKTNRRTPWTTFCATWCKPFSNERACCFAQYISFLPVIVELKITIKSINQFFFELTLTQNKKLQQWIY